MSTMAIGWIVFAIVFGGALIGALVRRFLPGEHLSSDSREVVKLGMGLIGTMAALVLSLLLSSAKASYDTKSSEVEQWSADVMLLDRTLAHYGPEAMESRKLFRGTVARMIAQVWPPAGAGATPPIPVGGLDGFYQEIQALTPKSAAQSSLQAQALATASHLAQTRWLMEAQSGQSIPMPFLVVMVFWLSVIFASFGLYAKPNATIFVALLVGALSISSAIFLILELEKPFIGLIRISSAPMQVALEQLGR
jgi:hypothetical protein